MKQILINTITLLVEKEAMISASIELSLIKFCLDHLLDYQASPDRAVLYNYSYILI